MIQVDYSKYTPVTAYGRQGNTCYLCKSRNKLIISTPEEEVRQSVVGYFVAELGIPAINIMVEVPMSYYNKGAKGRADIIVNDDDGMPLLLVECKERNSFLSDSTIKQVMRYDDIVKAKYIAITNGLATHFFKRTSSGLVESENLLTYKELLDGIGIKAIPYDDFPYYKTNLNAPIEEVLINELFEMGYLGQDTPPNLYPAIINLMDWMFDEDDKLDTSRFLYTNVVKDGGIRLASFGNAGGGSWGGDYRYFVIKDNLNNHQIISLSIISSMKTVNDFHWGNRKGYTYLAVAIDNFEHSHMSLELNMDKYILVESNSFTVWHDGKLTVGKKGQAKKKDVVEFVRTRAPHMVDETGKIILGTLPKIKEIKSEQYSTISFLDNLILYALLRDEYRRSVK